MFTTRNTTEEFVGRCNPSGSPGYSGSSYTPNGVMRSPLAEVCWFLRAGTLYRRVLLIRPQIGPGSYYYYNYDLSMHQEGGGYDYLLGPSGIQPNLTPSTHAPAANVPIALCYPNTLGNLTKREYRYAHQPLAFPHDMRFWNNPQNTSGPNPNGTVASRPGIGLPSMWETGYQCWPFPYFGPKTRYDPQYTQYMQAPPPNGVKVPTSTASPPQILVIPTTSTTGNLVYNGALASYGGGYSGWTSNYFTGYSNTPGGLNTGYINLSGNSTMRYDDVLMNHVLSFDVKVWDPRLRSSRCRPPRPGTGPENGHRAGRCAIRVRAEQLHRQADPGESDRATGQLGILCRPQLYAVVQQ